MITVSIIEDDADIRHGLELLINSTSGYSCLSAFADCEAAIKDIVRRTPEVLLMDIQLPGMSGIEGIRQIKNEQPNLNIIMLTVHDEDDKVFDSICAGASGYLLKTTPPAKILEAIKDVYEGGAPMSAKIARMVIHSFQRKPATNLTHREHEILSHLCEGQSYKMIAESLHISRGTVHSHIKNIYKKLEVNSMSEAVAKAYQEKLV